VMIRPILSEFCVGSLHDVAFITIKILLPIVESSK
jgi:hypothetical protein